VDVLLACADHRGFGTQRNAAYKHLKVWIRMRTDRSHSAAECEAEHTDLYQVEAARDPLPRSKGRCRP
jgi:hypothetical protein